MKTIFTSRTVQLAIFQAILGIAIIIATEAGEAGIALILKSLVDVALRYDTSIPIK